MRRKTHPSRIMAHYSTHSVLFFIVIFACEETNALDLKNVKYYELVEPQHVGLGGSRRNRRDLSTYSMELNKHLDETEFKIDGHNRSFNVRIYKNTPLIPESFKTTIQDTDGSFKSGGVVNHCYYHGYLTDRTTSFVTISTCYGLDGVIKDEDNEEFVLQLHPDDEHMNDINGSPRYILYNSKDVLTTEKHTCGVNHTHHDSKLSKNNRDDLHDHELSDVTSSLVPQTQSEHHRSRRANPTTKYIEMIACIDNALYSYYAKKKGSPEEGLKATQHRALVILNSVDSFYKMINTRVCVSDLIIWNTENAIPIDNVIGKNLDRFGEYTEKVLIEEKRLKFDHAHLILKNPRVTTVVGLAGVGTMCKPATAATLDDPDRQPYFMTASTVAHEIGHNLGFFHNKGSCKCEKPPCIMSRHLTSKIPKSFADCVVKKYTSRLEKGRLPCLFNYPRKFFFDPKCGNGLLEAGEQCDCGNHAECKANNGSQCCNFATCTFKSTAQCAQGPCCHNCRFKQKGHLCRKRLNECDLEDYCSGDSEFCPEFHRSDGVVCRNNSYCYKGSCTSLTTACKSLWGHTTMRGEDKCFSRNVRGDKWGNCGKETNSDKYIKCNRRDYLCGKLQCKAKPNTIMPRWSKLGGDLRRMSVSFYNGDITCHLIYIKFSPDEEDPTLTPDGVKCATDSICLENKCVGLSTLPIKKCERPCLNGGVCNNNGHCHCPKGRACPYCEFAGAGGSVDSGAVCNYGYVACEGQSYKREGCWKKEFGSKPNSKLLINGRGQIPWSKYQGFLDSFVCRCAKKAEKEKFPYFAIAFYGECWGINDRTQMKRPSEGCRNGKFKPCDGSSNDGACTGQHNHMYVYSFITGMRCNGQDSGCCTKDTPCGIGEGDCDNDKECAGPLTCGKDNCPWGDNDDCCIDSSQSDAARLKTEVKALDEEIRSML